MKIKFLGLLILFLFAVTTKLPAVSFASDDTLSLGHHRDHYVVADSDSGLSSPKTIYKILFFFDLEPLRSHTKLPLDHFLVAARFHISHLLSYILSGAIVFHQISTGH